MSNFVRSVKTAREIDEEEALRIIIEAHRPVLLRNRTQAISKKRKLYNITISQQRFNKKIQNNIVLVN
jgi:hypothetical protein